MIGRKQIAPLALGNMGEVRLPCIRKENRSAALVKPIDLLLTEQKNPTHNKFGNALWVRFGISKSQCGAPGSTKNLPPLNPQVPADFLDIVDQFPGGVGFKRRVRCALPAASLVKVNDAVFYRVEEAALLGVGATARTPVQKHHQLTGRIP